MTRGRRLRERRQIIDAARLDDGKVVVLHEKEALPKQGPVAW